MHLLPSLRLLHSKSNINLNDSVYNPYICLCSFMLYGESTLFLQVWVEEVSAVRCFLNRDIPANCVFPKCILSYSSSFFTVLSCSVVGFLFVCLFLSCLDSSWLMSSLDSLFSVWKGIRLIVPEVCVPFISTLDHGPCNYLSTLWQGQSTIFTTSSRICWCLRGKKMCTCRHDKEIRPSL